jgi:hypothetical protein
MFLINKYKTSEVKRIFNYLRKKLGTTKYKELFEGGVEVPSSKYCRSDSYKFAHPKESNNPKAFFIDFFKDTEYYYINDKYYDRRYYDSRSTSVVVYIT